MKKYLLLLLATVSIYGQTYPTNPTAFGKISINTNIEDNAITKMSVQSSDNRINWLQPINIPIPTVPTNYTPTAPTLGGHLDGINTKLGTIGTTTAGISTRVWFTADQTTITAGTFDLTNPLNKGTVAGHQQTVANDDGQKKYFTTDLIGNPFAMITTFPQGTYAGNLSVSTTPTNANQKFTVELYRCNNAGTPIASGVTGAVTGSLGVTVIMIMDSGEVTLANASVTNLPVSTILGVGGFTINAGERIRYHVSAEKVGTAGGVINESVYYGSSYNSFIDVPVIYNSSSIKDVSMVTNGTGTVTDALNTLKSSIPVVYSTVVYVNATNPNSATIFDDVNPPVVNDNALKANTNNLYVASDNTGWVYNSTSLLYVTKPVTTDGSNFYLSGTSIDSGTDKVASIARAGSVVIGSTSNPTARLNVTKPVDTSNNTVSTIRLNTLTDGPYSGGVLTFGQELNTNHYSRIAGVRNSTGIDSQLEFSTNSDIYNGSDLTAIKMTLKGSGVLNVGNLAGTGTRQVVADASGNLSANNVLITITTSTSITTATLDSNSVGQDGHHVVISNGVNAINLTCNGGVTTSYGKVGTGAITFVQGSGRTLVQLSGTAVLSGAVGSTATLWSNGTTDYLSINNY